MEVNKDEAERCIDIAVEAMKIHNYQRAEKFLTKANNLYPTQKGKGITMSPLLTILIITSH